MANVPGSIHEIESFIIRYQHFLSSQFDRRRLESALSLALMQLRRQTPSNQNQREDLDKASVHGTEAILLLPLSWSQYGPMVFPALFFLSNALLMRSNVSKKPSDAIFATKYLFHLRDQPHKIPNIPRHKITALLVEALALQVELEAGNVMQNIREIAVLSRELLTLETSDIDTTGLIVLIYRVLVPKIYSGVPDQPLHELIECMRAARTHRPDLLEGRIALAQFLVTHYCMTFMNDDYEEAASVLDELIIHTSGNTRDKAVANAHAFATDAATLLAITRSGAHGNPEHLEEAIYRARISSSSSSYKEHFPSFAFDPEVVADRRSRYFGPIEGVEKSRGDWILALPMQPWMLEASQAVDKMKALRLGIRNDDDTTKIDEAIEMGRSIIASFDNADLLNIFGSLLFEASNRTQKIGHLNESISTFRQVTESPILVVRFEALPRLSQFLFVRSQCFPGYRTEDLEETLELISQCASDPLAEFPSQFWFACTWADMARCTRHHSVSRAYETALSSVQDTLLVSPTLPLQHAALVTHDTTQSLPLDYASYQVDQHHLEEAIETLERGRALLWSEMCHLRVPIDQLLEADPDIGNRFATVNRDLEELNKSVPPSHKLSMDDVAADGLRAVDPFGRLLLKHRNLLRDRGKLILQIRALPGFDRFLRPSLFDTLRSAALSGPVIIINHSKWRSDILILLHNMPPSLIPTSDDFYNCASALKDELLESRHKYGLDSKDYDDTLSSVLAELYNLVGQPIIDRLRQLQVPEQSRIWWCTTSVFCSLPLHAMGPIPSDDGELRYFLDLYICSYTPTLSALIRSRHHETVSRYLNRPSILLVAQLDPSLPNVRGEIKVLQDLDAEVSTLISESATPAAVIDGFHHHQFVHFACHGSLEAGKPFEASFELYGNARLTLLEIVRSNLPAAEFAFLSACHTAEMTEGSNMDEGLHLAAAIQYCGFRSVVGTMWAMADIDGRDLAKYFCKELFSDSRGTPYHEKSAKALQFNLGPKFAVKKLRKKRGVTLERWINFVHYGA